MTASIHQSLADVLSELTLGAEPRNAVVLNGGDVGLLKSLDKLTAVEASQSAQGGATVAAHTQHLRYGLSLMNRWAAEGGDPFADASWEDAWKLARVNDAQWREIRAGLAEEVARWLEALRAPTESLRRDPRGCAGSVAHVAYHLGAIRQIVRHARGPREGTYT